MTGQRITADTVVTFGMFVTCGLVAADIVKRVNATRRHAQVALASKFGLVGDPATGRVYVTKKTYAELSHPE